MMARARSAWIWMGWNSPCLNVSRVAEKDVLEDTFGGIPITALFEQHMAEDDARPDRVGEASDCVFEKASGLSVFASRGVETSLKEVGIQCMTSHGAKSCDDLFHLLPTLLGQMQFRQS